MSLDGVLEIGKQKLVEYRPRLNVKGTKPFEPEALHLHQHYEGQQAPSKEAVEQMIDMVLAKLDEQTDGFWISEPPSGGSPATIRYSQLNLTFSAGYSGIEDRHALHVHCWYWPA